MKELTKAEEQVMQILWKLQKGFVKDVIDQMPEPKPAYNTVSTVIRVLEKKGFISHKAYGKTYEYYPVIAKEKYKKAFLKKFVKKYFSNSFEQLVSFFSQEEDISVTEMEQVKRLIEKKIENKKKSG